MYFIAFDGYQVIIIPVDSSNKLNTKISIIIPVITISYSIFAQQTFFERIYIINNRIRNLKQKRYQNLEIMSRTFNGRLLQRFYTEIPTKQGLGAQSFPSISLNQLQTQINSFKRKKLRNQSLDSLNKTNHKQLNVCSPFYDRMKAHKQNCKCPYHKKKKFQILPMRHTQKLTRMVHQSLKTHNQHKQENYLFRFSNKQNRQKPFNTLLSSSFDQNSNKLNRTVAQKFKPRINTKKQTYEQFVKECQYFMLQKKGFSVGKSQHVVRKGARQIFQFMNKNLDYTVQKMSDWINSTEKDKNYGQFYIDRFKQIKQNNELNKKQGLNKRSKNGDEFMYSSRFNVTEIQRLKMLKLKELQRNRNNHNSPDYQGNSIDRDNDHMSQTSWKQIMDQLKINNKVSNQVLDGIMNQDTQSFKQMFTKLQNDIIDSKYQDQLLLKLETQVISYLIKKNSDQNDLNNQNSQNNSQNLCKQHQKSEILNQTYELLNKFRNRKQSRFSGRKSLSSNALFSFKNNSQNGEYLITLNNGHSETNQSSLNSSLHTLSGTRRQSNMTNQKNFEAIQEQNQNQDGNSGSHLRNFKLLMFHGQKVRRSRILKPDQLFRFSQQFKNNKYSNISATSSNNSVRNSSILQPNKSFFRKAQKYLFQLNMGKAIIKKEDSIFTAKRKVRVIKMLLKYNTAIPEAEQLQHYIKNVEQRCCQKTQKDKIQNLNKKDLQNQELQNSDICRLLNLDNLGYKLIFYNLTQKLGHEDNQDYCIVLKEVRPNKDKHLYDQVTYKSLFLYDVDQLKKSQGREKHDQILIQNQMRNMQFQAQIQSEKQDERFATKRTTKTPRKSLLQLTAIANQTQMSGFYGQSLMNGCQQFCNEDRIDDMNKQAAQKYYQQIKKALRYAKTHLPQTFDTYVKNSELYKRNLKQKYLLEKLFYNRKTTTLSTFSQV